MALRSENTDHSQAERDLGAPRGVAWVLLACTVARAHIPPPDGLAEPRPWPCPGPAETAARPVVLRLTWDSAERGWVYSGHSVRTHSRFSGASLGEALGCVAGAGGPWRGQQALASGRSRRRPACTEAVGGVGRRRPGPWAVGSAWKLPPGPAGGLELLSSFLSQLPFPRQVWPC